MSNFTADFTADETFTTNEMLQAALAIITANVTDDFEVNVATEFERKGELNHRALNNPNPHYSSYSDDLLVSIQVRVPSWFRDRAEVTVLTDVATSELTARKEAATAAAIAEREAKVARLEAELAELRK